ncbi:ABC transporter permease [Nonomuraea cavernae]|uniref:Transport permease protein n=1 Tax=Nonomuraea cavernae TaxID=2045107 RepID=A0A917YNY9_9ACTN|nr:ABC transporter permease [Nonomuraea cavernae]MCA2184071.1 ABC transporter permease [Nonomuraea cavernae]GGO62229.1 transport permease protein [Nonomuraea cavernae]
MKKILAVETKLLLRDWPAIVFSLALPVGLLVVLGQIPDLSKPDPEFGGQRFVDSQLPAQMILLALLTTSFTVLPGVLAAYREQGVLRRMSTTPVHPSRLLGAHLLINLGVAVVAVVLVILAGWLVHGSTPPEQIFGFALVCLLGTAAMLAIGLVIASVAPNAKSAPGIGSVVMFPLMFVAGMWIPREIMPDALRMVSDYSVVGPFINAMRDTWAGDWPQLPHLAVMLVGLALFGGLAVRLFKWE